VVDLPSGEQAYTRSGSFQLSSEGEIITQEGNTVSPGVTIPQGAKDISVSSTGVVQYKLDGQTDSVTAGTLELANFINPNGLEALGDNLYLATTASGEAQTGAPGDEGFGTILGGYLENSNVDPVKEITSLIAAQRAYEMNSKVISASDEMLRTAAQIKG
jgi:flagellar basal-body rod protein FlgG